MTKNIIKICYISLFAIAFIASFYKIFTAPCFGDEEYYAVEELRLYKGQRLIADDWQIASLFSIFLYPFIYLFRIFNNTNDGFIMKKSVLRKYLLSLDIQARIPSILRR